MTTTRAQRIEAAVAGWTRDGDHGFRVVCEPVAVGAELPRSLRWDDGECTDEEIDGTCAIDSRRPDAAQLAAAYSGDYVLLVAGDVAIYGEDIAEIVMRDAVCEGCVYIGE